MTVGPNIHMKVKSGTGQSQQKLAQLLYEWNCVEGVFP